jgi:hypothetical protein
MKGLLFEHVTCSRCGGSGNYSYCQSYGTTCFKCRGSGAQLTKRGKAAQAWLNNKRCIPASEFKVGDKFLMDGIPGFSKSQWVEILSITTDERGCLNFNGKDTGYNGLPAETRVRRCMTNGEAAALKQEALAYQATLTKSGTVRKKAASAA